MITVRVLDVVDNFTRECLTPENDTSFAGQRVTRILDAIIKLRGSIAGNQQPLTPV